jgi:hypothetical protein
MQSRQLVPGDIVQINPDHDERFGASLMIITEPKPWGAQGAIASYNMKDGIVYYRCKFENMEYVGNAEWIPGHG